MKSVLNLQAAGNSSSSPAAKSSPLRSISTVARRLTGTVATVGRFLREFFGTVEVTEFDGRFCDCAEGYHEDGEACLLDGAPV